MTLRRIADKYLAISLITVGTLLGVLGFVRSGSVLIALGAAGFSFLQYLRSTTKRNIEIILPLLFTLMLFVAALTLPHAK